jgi:hypothetical protein
VIVIEDAFVVGGSCTSAAGLILCQLGDIAGGSSSAVRLSLRSEVIGSNSISVAVSADNDARADNNRSDGTLSIARDSDLAVNLQAPASVTTGNAINISFSATNLSTIDADSVTVSIALPPGIAATNATLNGNNCAIQPNTISCSLASLDAGATASGSASLSTSAAGSAQLSARVSGSYFDPAAGNDVSDVTVSVGSTMATTDQRSGSGGGGSSDILLLTALLGLLGLQNPRRRT